MNFLRQIFEKYPNMKFNENPVSGSRVVPCGLTIGRVDWQKHRHDEPNNRFSQQCERAEIGNQRFPNQVTFGTAFCGSISPTIPQLLRPQSWIRLPNMYPISSLVRSINYVTLSMFSRYCTQKMFTVNTKQTNELCPVLTNFIYIVLPMFLCYALILGLSMRLCFGIPNTTSNYTAERSSDFTAIPNAQTLTHALCLLDIFFTQYHAVHASTLYAQKFQNAFEAGFPT